MGYKRDIKKNEKRIIEIDKIIKNMESRNSTIKMYNALKVERNELKIANESWNILVGRYLHIKQKRYSFGLQTYVIDDYYIYCRGIKHFGLIGDIIYFKTTDIETKKETKDDSFGRYGKPGYGVQQNGEMEFEPDKCIIKDISKEKFDNKFKRFQQDLVYEYKNLQRNKVQDK